MYETTSLTLTQVTLEINGVCKTERKSTVIYLIVIFLVGV